MNRSEAIDRAGFANPVPVYLTNAPQTMDPIRAILYGAFLRKEVWLEFFGFDLEWNTLGANASGQQAQVTIDPGIDFVLLEMNLTAYSAAGTIVASPDYVLQLQERSGNSNLGDVAMHVSNWTGEHRNSGAKPFVLPFPRYIRGNNTMLASLTNRTSTAALVNVDLLGIRVTYNNTSRERLFGVTF